MPKKRRSSADRAAAARCRGAVDALARGAHAALADALPPQLARFTVSWPRRAVGACGTRPRRCTLPVLRRLGAAIRAMRPRGNPLAAALARAAARLDWRQTYRAGEVDTHFLANYGWAELVGTRGPYRSRALACGLLLLGPRTVYPPHRHPAEELYLPLSGTAEWRCGAGRWRRVPPGRPILHRRWQPHAMRTGRAPLLALYVWRGAGLAHGARLDAREGDV